MSRLVLGSDDGEPAGLPPRAGHEEGGLRATEALTEEDLEGCVRVLEYLAVNPEVYKSKSLRRLRASVHQLVGKQRQSSGGGPQCGKKQRRPAEAAPPSGDTLPRGSKGVPKFERLRQQVQSCGIFARGAATAVRIEAQFISRILYPNPVCLLSVQQPGTLQRNVMTISWLSPVDNDGVFMASINQRRHTVAFLRRCPNFVLSVPVSGMEPLVLAIGGCTGAKVDKLRELGVSLCRPGWAPLHTDDGGDASEAGGAPGAAALASSALGEASAAEFACLPAEEVDPALAEMVAVESCVAHVAARIRTMTPLEGHYLLVCDTLAAFVQEEYWGGKRFAPLSEEAPPILSFFGSQTFGYVCPTRDIAWAR